MVRTFYYEIAELLREMGLPSHLHGYCYLKDAIWYAINHPIQGQMTTNVYPTIADKYETAPSNIERNIRNAIEVSFSRGNTELINDVFGYTISYDKDRPTNTEFVSACAEYILNSN